MYIIFNRGIFPLVLLNERDLESKIKDLESKIKSNIYHYNLTIDEK